MSIFINTGSGGGGLNFSDATANADDVALGKIFYNAEGRQVGTSEAVNVKTVINTFTAGTKTQAPSVNLNYNAIFVRTGGTATGTIASLYADEKYTHYLSTISSELSSTARYLLDYAVNLELEKIRELRIKYGASVWKFGFLKGFTDTANIQIPILSGTNSIKDSAGNDFMLHMNISDGILHKVGIGCITITSLPTNLIIEIDYEE